MSHNDLQMILRLHATRALSGTFDIPLDISKIKNNLLLFSNDFVIDQSLNAIFIKKIKTFCKQANKVKTIWHILMRKIYFVNLTHKWVIVHKDVIS